MTSLIERWNTRRANRYLRRRQATQNAFPGLRRHSARRKLCLVHYGLTLAMLIVAIIMASTVHNSELAAPDTPNSYIIVGLWIFMTISIMFTYGLLNVVTNYLGQTPVNILDEYEASQVEAFRSFTYRIADGVILIFVIGLTLVGSKIVLDSPNWGELLPYRLGLIGIPIYILIFSLPTVLCAWTMKD